jgi:hypothetical protein
LSKDFAKEVFPENYLNDLGNLNFLKIIDLTPKSSNTDYQSDLYYYTKKPK